MTIFGIIEQMRNRKKLNDKINENNDKIKEKDEIILQLRKEQEQKDKIINTWFEERRNS